VSPRHAPVPHLLMVGLHRLAFALSHPLPPKVFYRPCLSLLPPPPTTQSFMWLARCVQTKGISALALLTPPTQNSRSLKGPPPTHPRTVLSCTTGEWTSVNSGGFPSAGTVLSHFVFNSWGHLTHALPPVFSLTSLFATLSTPLIGE